MSYKKFEFSYNKNFLLELFNSLEKEDANWYINCKNIPVESLPLITMFNRNLTVNEYGLSKLVKNMKLHINPNNNGLIIFPICGLIEVFWEDSSCIFIDQPTIINGKVLYGFNIIESPALFFAIKIPSSVTWDQSLLLL